MGEVEKLSTDSAFFLLCFLPVAAVLYCLLRGQRAGDILLLVLSLLFCAIQAIVYTMLTASYLQEFIEE